MQTFFVYILTFAIVVAMSKKAQKKGKRIFMFLAAFVLSAIAGLRAVTVGLDSANYADLFEHIANGRLDLAYGLETSFKYICAALLFIWNNPNFLFFVFALITNILILLRLWDFREQISLPWATAVYLGMFYFMTFNAMRQFVAVAIVFYASRYLLDKKYIRFCIYVLIASLFHRSAIVGIALIACDVFAWKYLDAWQKKLLKAFIIIGPIVILVFGSAIIGRYAIYLNNVKFNFGLMLFLKLFLFILTSFLLKGEYSSVEDNNKHSVQSYSITTTKTYYCLGILITMFGYFFPFVERIGLYFYLFETVYVGKLMKSDHIEAIIKFFIAILYLILLAMSFLGNGQGQGDYLFFWQI